MAAFGEIRGPLSCVPGIAGKRLGNGLLGSHISRNWVRFVICGLAVEVAGGVLGSGGDEVVDGEACFFGVLPVIGRFAFAEVLEDVVGWVFLGDAP